MNKYFEDICIYRVEQRGNPLTKTTHYVMCHPDNYEKIIQHLGLKHDNLTTIENLGKCVTIEAETLERIISAHK